MRGKVAGLSVSPARTGITPAYAGKSLAESGKTSKAWDHPRLCGEKMALAPSPDKYIGSPPPMRGKADFYGVTTDYLRITPAYAGKSMLLG